MSTSAEYLWEVEQEAEQPATFERPTSLGLWLVAIYFALFLIRPWEVLFPWMQALRLERVYAIVMLLAVMLTGRRVRWSAQTLAVAAFSLAVVISTLRAWRTELAWPPMYQYATVVVTYFVIVATCRRLSDMNCLILTYVLTMYAYLGKSLWEYFVHGRHEFAQNVSRLVGIERTYGEPNAVAMSAVLSLPLWYFVWCSRRELTRGDGGLWRRLVELTLWTYPLVALVAVGLTNSRAGMVGLAAFVAGVVWQNRRGIKPWRAALLVPLMLLGLWLVAPEEQQQRLRTLWNPQAGPANAQASAEGRWQGFQAALQMLEQRSLTGVGIGNFVPYRVAHLDGVPLVAHNLPGQILGETGWLGGACFLLLVAALWHNLRSVRRMSDGWSELQPYSQLAAALQLTLFLLLLFGFSLNNGLRYNWIWIAAFACLAEEFCREVIMNHEPA